MHILIQLTLIWITILLWAIMYRKSKFMRPSIELHFNLFNWLRIETSHFCTRLSFMQDEYVHLDIQLFKWQTSFRLYGKLRSEDLEKLRRIDSVLSEVMRYEGEVVKGRGGIEQWDDAVILDLIKRIRTHMNTLRMIRPEPDPVHARIDHELFNLAESIKEHAEASKHA